LEAIVNETWQKFSVSLLLEAIVNESMLEAVVNEIW
jgi:hypothetical protein